MPSIIRDFQTLTTRGGDVLPPHMAKSFNAILTALEAQYDRDRMLETLAAMKRHYTAKGADAHPNLIISGDLKADFLAAMFTRYNTISATPLTESEFTAIFGASPVLQLELMRRLVLNEWDYVDGKGWIESDATYYTGESILKTQGIASVESVIINALNKTILLDPAQSGMSYYNPVKARAIGLPAAGELHVKLTGFAGIPAQDRPIFSMTGLNGALHLDQVGNTRSDFKLRIVYTGSSEQVLTLSLAETFPVINLAVIYTPWGVSLMADDAGSILTDTHAFSHYFPWDDFHVHVPMADDRERGGYGDLRKLSFYPHSLLEVERQYALASL